LLIYKAMLSPCPYVFKMFKMFKSHVPFPLLNIFNNLNKGGPDSTAATEDSAWTDAEEEQAAIVEHDGGVLRAWAEGFARLDPSKQPGDVPPLRWVL
jgi:hypothetical protein